MDRESCKFLVLTHRQNSTFLLLVVLLADSKSKTSFFLSSKHTSFALEVLTDQSRKLESVKVDQSVWCELIVGSTFSNVHY